jgi:cytochrome c oxidase subunit IV
VSERRTILIAWAALVLLLAATTGGAYLPLGAYNLALALAIGVAKAAIVLVIFMRLGRGPALARVFAAAGFFWLGILLWLALDDYVTRPGAGL